MLRTAAASQWVFKWRLQAEERMRASGKPGMTDAQIADFVARFMPAYKAYLPGLYSKVGFWWLACWLAATQHPARGALLQDVQCSAAVCKVLAQAAWQGMVWHGMAPEAWLAHACAHAGANHRQAWQDAGH